MVLIGLLEVRATLADEPADQEPRIASLVRQLGSDSFFERQSADKTLSALGPAARKQLELAARNHNPEIRQRALRLLRRGKSLDLWVRLDLETGGSYDSYNVIGEIRGSELPAEYVVIGAHLDSWGLGTGALDNGCNVALVIDIARQMQRLGLRPRRTIRGPS